MQWYYAEDGAQKGPVEEPVLEQLIAAGTVRGDTLVWQEGMANWERCDKVRGPMPPPVASVPAGEAKYCSKCGNGYDPAFLVAFGEHLICANCKPAFLQSLREGQQTFHGKQYGGFWIRFGARIIDGILLGIVTSILQFGSFALFGLDPKRMSDPSDIWAIASLVLVLVVAITAVHCAYEVYFLTTKGATPGKMMLNLKVIRSDGGPISAGRATGRYFASVLSSMTFGIGYIIAGIDDQKRSMHDHICDTRVIRLS